MNRNFSMAARAALTFFLSVATVSFAAQKEVGEQKEADWIDARWNYTELGNFHSSLLQFPNGTVAKGLSIRVGDKGEAAVAYDTATTTLRAGWAGGFLTFDGKRYGLLNPPQPAGDLRFVSPAVPAWAGSPVKWNGLHVHGPRVVLDYNVGDVRVLESPGYENIGTAG